MLVSIKSPVVVTRVEFNAEFSVASIKFGFKGNPGLFSTCNLVSAEFGDTTDEGLFGRLFCADEPITELLYAREVLCGYVDRRFNVFWWGRAS